MNGRHIKEHYMIAVRPIEAECLRGLTEYLLIEAKEGRLALGEDEEELLEALGRAVREG